MIEKNIRTIWTSLIAILIALFLSGWLIYQQGVQNELDHVYLDSRNQLNLNALLVKERLQKRDYQLAKNFIGHWGENSPNIIEITLTTANGFNLAHYINEHPVTNEFKDAVEISYSYSDLATLIVRRGTDHVYLNQKKLMYMYLAGYFLISFIMFLLVFINIKTQKQKNEIERENSRRKETEKLLKASEKDLAITLNSIGDAVVATDSDGAITRMNAVAEKLTGWKFEDAFGKSVNSVFPIIDATTREPITNPVEKVIATGETVYLSNHTTLIAKDGSEFQISDSAAPIRNDENEILGMVLVFNDITEQYLLREAAAKSKKDLQEIMDHAPAVIYVKDTSGKYSFINQKFEKLFHIKRKDIVGKTDFDIFPEDLADKMHINDLKVLESRHAIEVEEEAPHDDGNHTYISIKFPLFNKSEDIHSICGISTDVTVRKIHEEKLRRSQKLESIGQLSGGIAHDFNNQLGIVIGYLDFLDELFEEDEMPHEWVATASKATLHCIELTRQLLAFSRNQPNETSVVDLNNILNEQKIMISRSVTPEVDVQYLLTEDLWLTDINVGDFEDAVLNLIINAHDAMPKGGKLIIETSNVCLDKEQDDLDVGDYVLLIISDTGTGMDKETQEQIFEPFFTTKPKDKGTGLGMSMVYGFTQRYKGHIKIYSELGVGTTFHLYLPRSAISPPKRERDIESKNIIPKGNESILIVDDEKALLQLADLYLTELGYITKKASNAEDAIKILKGNEKFNLLFSDVVMPGGMNGYELAEQATKLDPELKVLLTSGFTSQTSIEENLKHFSENLLSKPYRMSDIADRVRMVLDNKKSV